MKKLCLILCAAVMFGVLLNSCSINKNTDEDLIGMPPRVYMSTWNEMQNVVLLSDDYDKWFAYLNEKTFFDISFYENSDDQMNFYNFIKNIDVIVPKRITEVELLNSCYTFDRFQFSLDCDYHGLTYRFICQPSAEEFKSLTNEEYQLNIDKQHHNASQAVAIINNISIHMYWNEEYNWYAGSFIHDNYTYDVSVMKSEDRPTGTTVISEEWEFDIFHMLPLQKMFADS